MNRILKRVLAVALVVACMHMYFPRVGWAQQTSPQTALPQMAESVSTPEVNITESGTSIKWWMIALGVALVGIIAAAAGGGGGGSDPVSTTTTPSTGSVSVSW
jgi:uncharacterized membrane protein YfcA